MSEQVDLSVAGCVADLRRRVAALERLETPAGIDPAGHDHAKLVASDGSPDPALAADTSGFLTQHDDGTGDARYILDADVDDWRFYPAGEWPDTYFRFYNSGGTWYVELYSDGGVEIVGDTDISGDLEVSNALVVMASAEIGGDLEVYTRLSLRPAVLRTIAAGAISAVCSRIKVETQGGAATDNLDTINNGLDGAILILNPYDDTHDVVVTEAGNIALAGGNFTMDSIQDTVTLIYHAAQTKWLEMSRSDNG